MTRYIIEISSIQVWIAYPLFWTANAICCLLTTKNNISWFSFVLGFDAFVLKPEQKQKILVYMPNWTSRMNAHRESHHIRAILTGQLWIHIYCMDVAWKDAKRIVFSIQIWAKYTVAIPQQLNILEIVTEVCNRWFQYGVVTPWVVSSCVYHISEINSTLHDSFAMDSLRKYRFKFLHEYDKVKTKHLVQTRLSGDNLT